MHPSPARRGTSGITLIEVVVALGIGVLVMSVVLLAHRALTGHAQGISRSASHQRVIDETFAFFTSDLEQMFFMPNDDDCRIQLENSPTNLVMLRFSRWAEPSKSPAGLATQPLERITFSFVPDSGVARLVKVTEQRIGRGAMEPPRTNWAGKIWPNIRITLRDATDWRPDWPEKAQGAPALARIELLTPDGSRSEHETMVIIPAGLSVTSRVPRTMMPQP